MNYILNSWCRSSHSHLEAAYYLSKQGHAPSYQVYKVLFDNVQRRVMRRAQVVVATNDDDDDQILGFCIFEPGGDAHPPVLHYVQTKMELWRTGVAEAMLEHAGITRDEPCIYTFSSPILSKVKAPAKWSHIPHWLLEK